MKTFRHFCLRARALHTVLAVSLLFSPFPPGVAYWTDSDLDGVKEWIEGPAAEDSWWEQDLDGDQLTNGEELAFCGRTQNK